MTQSVLVLFDSPRLKREFEFLLLQQHIKTGVAPPHVPLLWGATGMLFHAATGEYGLAPSSWREALDLSWMQGGFSEIHAVGIDPEMWAHARELADFHDARLIQATRLLRRGEKLPRGIEEVYTRGKSKFPGFDRLVAPTGRDTSWAGVGRDADDFDDLEDL